MNVLQVYFFCWMLLSLCFCGNSTENKKDKHNGDIYDRCHFRKRRGSALLLTNNDNNITLVCVNPVINYVRRQINGYSSVKFNIRNHSSYELKKFSFSFLSFDFTIWKSYSTEKLWRNNDNRYTLNRFRV